MNLKQGIEKAGTPTLIILIILVSFFHFSESFYPWLNADAAINILMAESFRLPNYFYFWGQDRGGSLVPLLGNFFYKHLGFGLVLSVSVAHYLVLAGGYLALSQMIKSNWAKVALALFWFLPPWHMQYFLVYNFLALQTCLTVIMVYMVIRSLNTRSLSASLGWMCLAGLSLILGCWVSDLTYVSVLIFFVFAIFNRENQKQIIPWIIFFMAGILSIFLIRWAKSFATPTPEYLQNILGNKEAILSNIRIFLNSILDILLFRSETYTESIHYWILLAGLPFLMLPAVKDLKNQPGKLKQRWVAFFFLNAMAILLILLSSNWLYRNGTGRWYFVPVYYFLLAAFLLFIDPFLLQAKRYARLIIIIIALSASFSGLYPLYFPNFRPAKIDTVSELRVLGDAGIIGDYWNAYVIACVNPGHIAATPHDQALIRQPAFVKEVFAKPRLYLVKDFWFVDFPDSITQFGRTLYKNGREFHLGDCSLCRYRQKD